MLKTANEGGRVDRTSQQMPTECIAQRVRHLSRIITQKYDAALRPHGITMCQFTVLSHLARHDSLRAVDIGNILAIEKSTMSRNLQRLVNLGLIVKDRFAGIYGREIRLSPLGREKLQEAYPGWQKAQAATSTLFGPDIQCTLDSLVEKAQKSHQTT